jgi:gliding motility-associated-like protein
VWDVGTSAATRRFKNITFAHDQRFFKYMKAIQLTVFVLFTTFFRIATLSAQANDDCTGATFIPDPTNFCSAVAAADNTTATPSNVPAPSCYNTISNDVWFSFTAVASDVYFSVKGNTAFSPGGTLVQPFISVYSGTCPNNLTEIGCTKDQFGNNILEIHTSGLVPGQTYFIRVSSVIGGTFQYCIKNFFSNGAVSGDCPKAVVLCDKSSFNVQAVSGAGSDPTELDHAPCFNGLVGETNTTWYVFTASQSGTLTFTLTPNNLGDDLDFVLFQLPFGPGNCAGKIVKRCMAAGDFDPNSPCMGPTGLDTISTFISRAPGCLDPNETNFLQALQMNAGETYALAVNNFTSSGNGFQVDFGGTAQFRGPVVGFESTPPDSMCTGQQVVFTDTSSTSNGSINQWHWSFGDGSTLDSISTKGPHTLQYKTAGLKTVAMTIHTTTGCEVSATHKILVKNCCALQASVKVGPDCLPDTTCGMASVTVKNGIGPYQYNWSNGHTDSTATHLDNGDYSVTVTDALGCKDTVHFKVNYQRIYFHMPNVFTPNGDNLNDQFYPVVSLVKVVEFQVWDRWGKVVHSDPNVHWDGTIDGKQAPSDVYAYHVVVQFPDGHQEMQKGDVTLLR